MRYFSNAAPFLGLLASVALLPAAIAKPYPVHIVGLEQPRNDSQIEKRQCAGEVCGDQGQLCCESGTYCGVDSRNNWAICVQGTDPNPQQQATTGGSWQYYTSTWVETDFVTRTSVYSSWIGAAVPTVTPTSCGGSQMACGTTCCDGGYYCFNEAQSQCRLIGGSSSPGVTAIPTATGTPTNTVPFSTPIPTGANGTAIPVEGGGGLSGGAIAGIVIGVILGLLLLLFLCLYCCAKTAFDAIAAIFGFGKKKRRHTHEETYIEEHHHHSGSAAGGGRRWYGQPSRPGRPEKKKKGGLGGMLGVGAALGTMALALGMKRKHDKKKHYHDDKSTTISGSSAYYSDYTSSSSASSSDRHTRPTRHSSRR